MFITIPDGTRINLSLVKYISCDEPTGSNSIVCSFEFIDGSSRTGAISPDLLALIDATFTRHRN